MERGFTLTVILVLAVAMFASFVDFEKSGMGVSQPIYNSQSITKLNKNLSFTASEMPHVDYKGPIVAIGAHGWDGVGYYEEDAGKIYVYSRLSGDLMWTFQGDQRRVYLGGTLNNVLDINGDGYGEIVAGSRLYDGVNGSNSGKIFVLSSKNGEILQSKDGEEAYMWFGYYTANVGDINKDGYNDIGVIEYFKKRLHIFSGKDFTEILMQDVDVGVTTITSVGDINKDGYDDIGVGFPYFNNNKGKIEILSGKDGQLIMEIPGENNGDMLTIGKDKGDFNDDGYNDILAYASFADGNGKKYNGKVYVFSGKDGQLLFSEYGEKDYDRFGGVGSVSFSPGLSWVGDINKDGYDDFIVGAPYHYTGINDCNQMFHVGFCAEGKIYVYLGGSGVLLWSKDGEVKYSNLGSSVSGIDDFNGDGYVDVVVGAHGFCGDNCVCDSLTPVGPCFKGKAFIYSGIDGTELWQEEGENEGDVFGRDVSSFK
jgi:hypothetical protein